MGAVIMPNVDYVNAKFGGNEVRMAVSRNAQSAMFLERALGGSIYAAFQRFGNGTWRLDDIRVTLTFAHPDSSPASQIPMLSPLAPFSASAPVVAVLEAFPPGVYAPLSARILEAFLFGIDQERSQWNEEHALL